ncbi:4'-phosphopantetheinyl transferase [Chryseobacterium sp. RU37D]|uniref:4'-phosphopantetheinyl transferase family protein n=1 Tax=Chryseobacterium sp. RU37D TaxID=1907397 RepID=UPI0009539F2C|nr:4'-phosphopantetheinyl transferase superfamily protein [Chryseobacterium sp. RU37D]SIQ64992.1 4'-phosphopantetheinyl transferase [Chryseobacterium sp. RU37D]
MEVWVIYSFLCKNNSERIEELFSKLPENLVKSINQYKYEEDRKSRIISKLLLEILVRKIAPDQNFFWNLYQKDSFSKPYFKGLEINFSTSHHENFSVVCATGKNQCGIDSELIKPLDVNIYKDFLHPNEQQFIHQQLNPQTAFYEIWTKKEAVLKASGLGISQDLQSIDAHENVVQINNEKYFTKELNISENSITYIATDQQNIQLNLEEVIF